MTPPRETVVIELIDEGDPYPFPGRTFGQRLRAMLKSALRRDGLRVKRLCDGERVEIVTKDEGKQ
jgi:hypothetical protein